MTPHKAFFGDGPHDFALKAEQISELERLAGVGIGALCRRLFAGDFAYSDLTNTIRLALIGGGLDPKEASELVTAYVPMQSLSASMLLATAILSSLYFGPDDGETVGLDMTGEVEAA